MFGQKFFPYSTLQELNLDWILTKVKNILRFVPDDGYVGQILRRTKDGAEWSDEQGGGGSVTSVNGMQGAVVLTAADVGALPDTTVIPDSTSDLVNDSGFVDAAGAAAAAPVQSVSGKTGAVVLTKSDVGLTNVQNVMQYSSLNPPPYPVTSVNGQTGDVVISVLTALDVMPVGYIYMSTVSTSPAILFGGAWQRLEDRFLLGAGTVYTAGDTGGEASHTLTVDEMPSHNHGFKRFTGAVSSGSNYARIASAGDAVNDLITNTGGDQAHNNMPPYLVVYMWKRTA